MLCNSCIFKIAYLGSVRDNTATCTLRNTPVGGRCASYYKQAEVPSLYETKAFTPPAVLEFTSKLEDAALASDILDMLDNYVLDYMEVVKGVESQGEQLLMANATFGKMRAYIAGVRRGIKNKY